MPLLINGIILMIFGFLAVYSVSIFESFSLSLCNTGSAVKIANCLATFPEPTNYFYFYQQIKALLYIAVGVFIVRKFPMKILKSHKFATVVLIGGFLLQCLVFTSIGASYGTIARGRLDLPGLPSIQPSELFKLAFVFFLSSRLLRKKDMMKSTQFLINFVVLNAALYAIFLAIPDF